MTLTDNGRSPGANRGGVLVGIEDLEPDFAHEVKQNFEDVRDLQDHLNKLQNLFDTLKDKMIDLMQSEISKLKTEVRSTLTQHFEYL
jgi:hypothetical protein